jgi:signal transduction histidine kinase
VPLQKEIFYQGEGIQNWYQYVIVKKGEDEVVITFADITPQKQAALDNERQKVLLDNILKHSPTGISVTEVIRDEAGIIIDGRTIIANEAAAEFTGIPIDVYLTKTVKEIDPKVLTSPLYQMSISSLQTGKPFHAQYFFEAAGKWLELSVSKLDDDHLINVFMDVTSTKEAQLQLEKSIEELKRTNSNLEQFTYAASHDLKEPIRKIRTFADRLKIGLGSCMNEKEQLWFSRLENATDRMKLLVDDLLTYSYVNLSPDATEVIDLNDKLRLVLGDLELLIEEKHAMITVGYLPKIRGFRRQIQQLFQNLIGNALKYSKPGVPPEIDISCRIIMGRDMELNLSAEELNEEYYLIEVSDNGIGFEQKDAERMFNVFQRLHANTDYKGTGVGLSIARKVAENHKGFLIAKGEPGKGATFQIFLPVTESTRESSN